METWSTWSEPPTEPHDFHSETEELFSCLDKVEQERRLEAVRQKAKQKEANAEKINQKRQQQRLTAEGLLTTYTQQIQRWETDCMDLYIDLQR